MKKTLISIMLFASSTAMTQFSRSFFNVDPTRSHQETYSLAEGDTNIVFHVYQDSLDEIYLKIGKTNKLGDLIVVKTVLLETTAMPNLIPKISGVILSSDGSFLIRLLTKTSSQTEELANYKVENGVLITSNHISWTFNTGFIKTEFNNNELITYAVSSTQGLVRLATNQSSLITTVETIDSSIANSVGNYLNNRKIVEFTIVNNEEFSFVNNQTKIYKRSVGGTISSLVLSNLSTTVNKSIDLVSNNNEVYLFEFSATNTNIIKVANNLSSQSNNTISLLAGDVLNTATLEVLIVGVDFYLFTSDHEVSKITKVDNNNQIINTIDLKDKINFSLVKKTENGFVICGVIYQSTNYRHMGFSGDIPETTPLFKTALIFTKDLFQTEDFIEYSQYLTHGNLKTRVNNGINLFDDHINGTGDFNFTTGGVNGTTIRFAKNNILGLNSNQVITESNDRFFPGPYTTGDQIDDVLMSEYNRGYYVTRQMIETHIDNVQWGTIGYVAPLGIRNWPAHGDVSKGQAANLAEFMDENNNGVYEPYLGDYPLIYGDKCILTLQNSVDPLTNSKIEWFNYFYTLDCTVSEAEKNTVFLKSIYINRGEDLSEAYFSNLTDFDIGNPQDDYAGTNVETGSIYGYNGDNNDETSGATQGFDLKIPSCGMQLLQGAKLDADLTDNPIGISTSQSINGFGFGDGIIDNEYFSLESSIGYASWNPLFPNGSIQHYNVAKGLKSDGSSQTVGNTGIITNFYYPGNTDPLLYATNGIDPGISDDELSLLNPKGDRLIQGSSGPFTFLTNEKTEFLQAFTVAVDSISPPNIMNSAEKLFEYQAELKAAYAINETACGNDFGTISKDLSVKTKSITEYNVNPNPFTNQFTVDGLITNSGSIEVLNLEGKIVYSKEIAQTRETIEIPELSNGMYLIKITNNGYTSVKKILKR